MELACTQKNNCSSRNDELWFGKETDVIGLIRKALLILVQPQLVAELLFHSLRYKKLARRRPIAGEPLLAHPPTSTPVELQVACILDFLSHSDAAILSHTLAGYSIGYPHRGLEFRKSLTK